ncbi:hypothetical protein BDW22DRAFT_858649 [Trametopsis cervina]|nr:hypothetical protein BDW22DRAFT_858649 [Trametopsis cervina]
MPRRIWHSQEWESICPLLRSCETNRTDGSHCCLVTLDGRHNADGPLPRASCWLRWSTARCRWSPRRHSSSLITCYSEPSCTTTVRNAGAPRPVCRSVRFEMQVHQDLSVEAYGSRCRCTHEPSVEQYIDTERTDARRPQLQQQIRAKRRKSSIHSMELPILLYHYSSEGIPNSSVESTASRLRPPKPSVRRLMDVPQYHNCSNGRRARHRAGRLSQIACTGMERPTR